MNIPQEQLDRIKGLKGCISTVVISGNIDPLYASCHEELRAFNITNGFTNVEYRRSDAKLVEAGRDAEVAHMLAQNYDWLLQIDADASFPQDALVRVLHSAYVQVPDSDMVGAYCQLKGPHGTPTIDTGSGTWEVHFPGEGILPVIRTGAHFILTKRSAFEKMKAGPYFRTRLAPRAIDIMAEMDNLSRQKLDGRNPFSDTPEWQKLIEIAAKGSDGGPSSVGEDSGFCDRLKACGGQIYVDTGIVTGHVAREVITPARLKEAVDMRAKQLRLACGLLT